MSVLDKFINKDIDLVIEWTAILVTMLDDDEQYGYAEETLAAILEYVEKQRTITEKQMTAVRNIQAKPSNPYHSYGRRRY